MGAVMEFFNPVVDVLGGLSLAVKVGWAVWLGWGVAQLAWYFWPRGEDRIYRTTPAAAPRPSGPRPVAVRPAKKVVGPVPVAPYGTSDFIAALDQEQQMSTAAAVPAGPEQSSAYR